MIRVRRSVPAFMLLALTGCMSGSERSRALNSEVRDSAGVTIVDNQAPAGGSRMTWEVSATPTVTIGTLDGDEAYQLFRVRSATRLADGRLLVADGGSSEIRVFESSGVYIDSWGFWSTKLRYDLWFPRGQGSAVVHNYNQGVRMVMPNSEFELNPNFTQADRGTLCPSNQAPTL